MEKIREEIYIKFNTTDRWELLVTEDKKTFDRLSEAIFYCNENLKQYKWALSCYDSMIEDIEDFKSYSWS